MTPHNDIDGLVQDCGNSIANAMELLQSCTKPSICVFLPHRILKHEEKMEEGERPHGVSPQRSLDQLP